jgi:hypothetical protein
MKNIHSPRFYFITSAVVLAALTRFIPHEPNFTAVGSMALFAGALMPKRWMSLLVPMITLLLTDLVLGFHNTMWAVYGSFAIITMMGWMLSKRQNTVNIIGASVVAALFFFFTTNAAVWIMDINSPAPFFSSDFSGLMACIEMGLPFLKNQILSQALFGAVLFGTYYLVKSKKPALVQA